MHSNAGYFDTIAHIEKLLAGALPDMMPLMERLFPICRSITGPGLRQTLDIIGERIPLHRERVPSGTRCFDWVVPDEWAIRSASVKDAAGNTIVDFDRNNLHVVGYSVPLRARMPLAELQEHLHSRPDMPDAIPYCTSYYTEYWGFCLSHHQRMALEDGMYDVVIDSTLAPGHLDYGECILKGTTEDEVLFSTYVCHPSMGNNELSGPVLATHLMALLKDVPDRRFTYRAVFAPETIGAIAYLARHHEGLKQRVNAGYVISCVGDDGPYTYVRSRRADTLADRVGEHVARHVGTGHEVIIRDFDPIGSDERQYCSPGIDLPVGSMLRSRHGEYAEYHTSKDDLAFVSEQGMAGSLRAYLRIVQAAEMNCRPVRTAPCCEPQLGRHGLYSSLIDATAEDVVAKLLNLTAFADGEQDLLVIAERLGCPIWELADPLRRLVEADILRLV